MRKLALLSAILLLGCGGGEGQGSSTVGFYSLSVSLLTGTVDSPAVTYDGTYAWIEADRIEGTILLRYDGSSSSALNGHIRKMEVCISGSCFPASIGGILPPGQTRQFTLNITSHKYDIPWIVINPYEDEVVEENILSDTLSSGVKSDTVTDSYYNSQRTVYANYYPILEGSVQMSAPGDFIAGTVFSGYDSSLGTVTIALVKGVNTANTVVPSTFVADIVGTGIVCIDDGNGNIVQQGGGTDCSGTIDYTRAVANLAVNNVSSPTDINMSYVVSGSQMCWDEGGVLKGDCDGSIAYTTGQIDYSFRFDFTDVPVTTSISYLYQTGTSDGLTYIYVLPSDGADPTNPSLKIEYGDWVGVYLGNTLLCDIETSGSCTVSKEGRQVTVTFPTPQTSTLEIRYSERKKYDFNPSIDATLYNHSWNGQTSMYVEGSLNVEVQLEDGTTLSTSLPLTFFAYPQKIAGSGSVGDEGTLF